MKGETLRLQTTTSKQIVTIDKTEDVRHAQTMVMWYCHGGFNWRSGLKLFDSYFFFITFWFRHRSLLHLIPPCFTGTAQLFEIMADARCSGRTEGVTGDASRLAFGLNCTIGRSEHFHLIGQKVERRGVRYGIYHSPSPCTLVSDQKLTKPYTTLRPAAHHFLVPLSWHRGQLPRPIRLYPHFIIVSAEERPGRPPFLLYHCQLDRSYCSTSKLK